MAVVVAVTVTATTAAALALAVKIGSLSGRALGNSKHGRSSASAASSAATRACSARIMWRRRSQRGASLSESSAGAP